MSSVVVEQPVREVVQTPGPVVVVQNVQREVVEVAAGTVVVERVRREVLTTQTTVVVERVQREVLQVPGTVILGGTPLQYAPPVDLGDTNAEGTQATVARSDHVHRRSLRVRANGQS
ncbi:MAG TPA: hypothetical protein VNI78_04715, partial [Vicinamibacterales bacterium]|nr:hypothetical protein [Vicinamibacterales bacterium]